LQEIRICADGAANRLYDKLPPEERIHHIPDCIKGDLDSLRPDVREVGAEWRAVGENLRIIPFAFALTQYYESHGTCVLKDSNQDNHDFVKCMEWIGQRQKLDDERFNVVALGAFGGRLDHEMANLHALFLDLSAEFRSLVLLSEDALAFLLRPGKHVIQPNFDVESRTCGLIPLGP
jgi:thiamine pyrophosphokinase